MSSAVDDEDIIEVLSESDDVELTTTAVADELPISRGYTRTRLQRLVDDGRLERRREGNSIVWWLPERADDAESTEADADDDEADADADDDEADADADDDEADADETDDADEPDESAADEDDEVGEEDDEAADEDDEVGEEDEDGADEADEGPQSVEVEAVASEDDEARADEGSAVGDADAADAADVADEADEKPATATGTETPASAPEAGSDGESGDSVGPDERPTVRVREHGAPTSRGGPDSLAKLLGVAALVLLVFALLRRLRRR